MIIDKEAIRVAWENMPSPQEVLRKECKDKLEALQALINAIERYPELHKHTDRWNNVRYSTVEVNTRVNDCQIKHNCGCCSDSPLEVWPYIEEDGICIFSDPAYFTVGERNPGGGEMPHSGWEERLRSANIPETVVEKVAKMFKDNPWDWDPPDD